MAEIADYMSWNIEKFSGHKSIKEIFRSVEVPYWISTLILEMEANIVGIMEVTLATGADAIKVLAATLNQVALKGAGGANWTYYVSDRNVDVKSKVATRADKYALVWDSAKVNVGKAALGTSATVKFTDRKPLYWQMQNAVTSGKVVNCLLWHAPQPKYHEGEDTIQEIADVAAEYVKSTNIAEFVVSGDFNYDTSDTSVYGPLTKMGFTGVFDGSRTTLSALKTFMNDEANRKKLIFKGMVDEAFLSSAYDNVFLRNLNYKWGIKVCLPYAILQEIQTNVAFQIVTRSETQQAMQCAKIISDHMPLVLTVFE